MTTLIVLDANTWIRFARNKGIEPLFARIEAYDLMPVVNSYMLTEIFKVLVRNEWMTEAQSLKVIDFIKSIVVIKTEQAVYRISPDPKDNYLFDLAIQTNAAYIISDDSALLILKCNP
ncbi:MAG: putative toxin-antitoxin system toxin component, PIN family [Sphingobacteriales bacterium]|nr:putative toxin-antitoxin system toxin component, PIN family [Sphingobacteriales bacterium]OJY91353.1 MAG: putative toxin-antitoxin system toxin component, PIN family [Sphingobacteriales bacterium 44-15]